MRLILAVSAVAALGLVACETPAGPAETGAPVGGDAPAAADSDPAPATTMLGDVDLGGDISVLGTEPFWAVGFEGEVMSYSGLDRPEQTAPRPEPVVAGSTATWTTTTEAGNPLVVILTEAECSDGMSDRTYPLTAEVVISGEALNGCAGSTAWMNSTDENGNPVSG
jgi:uncharacterized membrane protein